MAESWSFLFEGDHPERIFTGGRADFCEGPFEGCMERVEIRPGFQFYRIAGKSSHPYALVPEGVTQRGTLALGSMLGGAGRIATEGVEEQLWRDERSFFALTPERQVAYHLQPGGRWRTVGLVLSPEALAELADGDELPELALATLEGKAEPFSTMRPLGSAATARLAADLFDPPYTGRMAALHRQARCIEFLAGLLEMLGGEGRPGEISARDKMLVRAARERLVADLRRPPDLHDLAHSVGLSTRKLNDGFRAVFGTTAFEHLRDVRLDAARQMLEEGEAMPLKQIAWRVGYAHPTNFINAYRRRFGASPARHRRGRATRG